MAGQRVLVTGISGFIAGHVALDLLQRGYTVRGTVRSLDRTDRVTATLAASGGDVTRLEYAAADLTKDEGWADAVDGCTYVQHLASPFPLQQPRDREALVPTAVGGVLRVLDAAHTADVERVVMTSSIAAMIYRPDRPARFTIREDDWTDVEWKHASAYVVSKTRAERAAWAWADERGWSDRLVAINPGLVFGPALDGEYGSSLEVIELLLKGAYPALPPANYVIADVRDVAKLHVRAMETPAAGGRRLLAGSETMELPEIAHTLRDVRPERADDITVRRLPAWLVRLLAPFDRALVNAIPDIGAVPEPDTAYVTELTGVDFRPAREAIAGAAESLVHLGV